MPILPDSLLIRPLTGPFNVTIDDLPGSKSLTNRALLLAALSKGKSKLTNVLFADDTLVMMQALQELGFKLKINEAQRTVTIKGRGGTIPASEANLSMLALLKRYLRFGAVRKAQPADMHLDNAGTAMRFLTAVCCLGEPGSIYTLDGIARMHERPIGQLVDLLRQLGAKIEYMGNEGFPPLKITAYGLTGGDLDVPPDVISSQFVSALLQVGPFCRELLQLQFDGPITSRPYVKMTQELMGKFGGRTNTATGHTSIGVGHARYKACDYPIEPDASNASYFLAAAAIIPESKIIIKGLGVHSIQGDAHFIDILAGMRAGTYYRGNDDISLHSPSPLELRGKPWDLNEMPDMAQTLAVMALFAPEPTVIRNVGNLRVKETDRLAALQTELTKLGAKVTIKVDDITIEPPANGIKTPTTIDTYDDHRMAMSFAVVGLKVAGITINNPSCVNKTFPDFFDYLDRLHA